MSVPAKLEDVELIGTGWLGILTGPDREVKIVDQPSGESTDLP